jgi:hypothetical protein
MPRTPLERVEPVTRWVVVGSLPFPIDMLRYDSAWPASESSSSLIERTIRCDTDGPVQVVICTRRRLTVSRWESRGWKVLRQTSELES